MVLVVKLQAAPVGSALQLSDTFAAKTPCVGATTTVYCADWPAATVWPDGAIDTEKPVAVNEAFATLCPELVVFVSFALDIVAVASYVPGLTGVTLNTTDDVDPACSVGIWQAIVVPLCVLHVPEPALALLKVTPVGTSPVTMIPVATSGPSFARV